MGLAKGCSEKQATNGQKQERACEFQTKRKYQWQKGLRNKKQFVFT